MSVQDESSQSEINTVFGRCRCCLDYGYMKSMWEEHNGEDEREIYGEMLMETFSIAWDATEDSNSFICDMCVKRLRDAYNFKKEVLASEVIINENSDEEMDDTQDDMEQYTIEVLEEEEEMEIKEENEYEEVEYLEEYAGVVEEATEKSVEVPKTGVKRNRKVVTKHYKNYSASDMRKALAEILENQMSVNDASEKYNVPKKTLLTKLYDLKNKKVDDLDSLMKQKTVDAHYRLVEDITTVLTYTTATPFKVKASQFYCAFCYTNVDSFDRPSNLRSHMKNHDEEIFHTLDKVMRPQFQNEVLRVDIVDLSCKVCKTEIPSWNDMFQHLFEKHGEELDQAYTKLIPYKLINQSNFTCGLCASEFPNFQFLDLHMNAHFCNYMCSDCGDTFVTEVRLKHHQLIHNTGKFPCSHCGKIFSLEKYRKKHEAMVHQEFKMFKCQCGEEFHKEYERHLHVMEKHPERVRISTCEYCGKAFDWRPYYLAHLRKTHSTYKKNVCRYCNKRFVTKHEVKQHELRHTGDGKHVCVFCEKRFVTPVELRKHSKRHIREVVVQSDDYEAS